MTGILITNSPAMAITLCVLTALAVVARHYLIKAGKRRWPVTVALFILAVLAYLDFAHVRVMASFVPARKGAYHYFMGAKYFKEVGQFNLYRFTLLADKETKIDRLKKIKKVRNQQDYELMRASQALKLAIEERPRAFSDERWAEFKRDWVAMSRDLPPAVWERMLQDRGFNPPPFWSFIPGTVAQFIDISNNQVFMWAMHIDMIVFALAVVVAGLCCGLDAALLVFLYVVLAWFYESKFIGTYFQFFWLAGLIVGMSLLRRGFGKISAACFALSAMLRLFPLMFVTGPGIAWLRDWWQTRRWSKAWTGFLLAFFIASLVFVGIGLTRGRGPASTKDFVSKITMHADNQKFDTNKFGLKRAIALKLTDPWPFISMEERVERFFQNKALYDFLLVAIVGLMIAAVWKKVDGDAWVVPLGAVIIFALMTASRYYFLLWVVFLIPGRENDRRGFAAFAAALLFLNNALMFLIVQVLHDRAAFTAGNFGFLACSLLFPLYLLLHGRRETEPEKTAQP